MKKELIESGKNGTFKGRVIIKPHGRSEQKMVQNPMTHDESLKTITYHVVEGYVNDSLWRKDDSSITYAQAVNVIRGMEEDLIKHLKFLCNRDTEKDFTEIVKQMGYE